MGKRNIAQIITWKRVADGEMFTKKYSFKTAESAIKDAEGWMIKHAKGLDREVVKVEIIDKETGSVVWNWEA